MDNDMREREKKTVFRQQRTGGKLLDEVVAVRVACHSLVSLVVFIDRHTLLRTSPYARKPAMNSLRKKGS